MEKLLDFSNGDVVLRSSDSRDFRILKWFIIKSSLVLDKSIRANSNLPAAAVLACAKTLPPIVHMSESGATLHNLLSFCSCHIFLLQVWRDNGTPVGGSKV